MTSNYFLKCFLCFCCLTSAIFEVNGCMNSSVCLKRIKRASNSDECPGCCFLPNYPTNGIWKINNGVNANPGSKVKDSTVLIFSCNPLFKLSTKNGLLVCFNGKWYGPLPTCLNLCPPLMSTKITKVTCFDENNVKIECNSALNGASARYKCADFYEPIEKTLSTRYCYNGQWNKSPPQCTPVCGQKRQEGNPLIVNGYTAKKGDYPWVTAIFHQFENVCAGSMLTEKLIITAAHCVSNEYGNPLDKTLIQIAVGKHYNKYKDPRDSLAQYSEVMEIIVHPSYRGENQHFASDIAFLITKDFLVLSLVAQPVCYIGLPNIYLTSNDIGVITGWGYTTAYGNASNELQEMAVPYKEKTYCISEFPKDWTDQYFTYDKLCAGHLNKSIAVCKGDSGGGLVFRNEKDSGRYYIHGLVSISYRTEDKCNTQLSSLYTKVAEHYTWLEKLASRFRYEAPPLENYEEEYKKERCILPEHPINGKWNIQSETKASPGTEVESNTDLVFSCDTQYKLTSKNKILTCVDGSWSDAPPSCIKLCPPLNSTQNTYVTCYDKNMAIIPCDSASEARAIFKCAPFYKIDKNTLSCYNGSWIGSPLQCVPELCPPLNSTQNTYVTCYDKNMAIIPCDSASEARAIFNCAPFYKIDKNTLSCYNGSWIGSPLQCVPEPVRVTVSTNMEIYPVGSKFEITCEVLGNPMPQVQWYKDGVRLWQSQYVNVRGTTRYNILTIEQATRTASGNYQCVASNADKIYSSSVKILIQGIHPRCTNTALFVNCADIVQQNYCFNLHFARTCCWSCAEAGLLSDEVQNTVLWAKNFLPV